MDRYTLAPPADLAGIVDRFWGWRSAPGETTSLAPYAPGVGAELFFHLDRPFATADSLLPTTHVLAMRTRPLYLTPARDLDFVAIRFRAGAFRHVLAATPTELPEGTPDATGIWGSQIERLLERLAEAPTFQERSWLLAGWARAQRDRHARPDAAVDEAIDRLYANPAESRVEAISRAVGFGPRQLERRFTAAVGIGPKRFGRLTRAYKLVRAQALDPGRSYLPHALDLGYYDQAHAIHELAQLAGLTPTALFAELATKSHFYNPSRHLPT